jgi:hypothetical protein
VGVAVALDRLRRRGQRDRVHPGQDVRHLNVEDRDGPEEDAPLAGLVAGFVTLLHGNWGEDPDRLLALADAPVQGKEGAIAGYVGRGDPAGVTVDRDQPLVAKASLRSPEPCR